MTAGTESCYPKAALNYSPNLDHCKRLQKMEGCLELSGIRYIVDW